MVRNRYRTTIEFWEENESWKATEPASDADLIGRGETAPQAVANLAQLLEDSTPDQEVRSDA